MTRVTFDQIPDLLRRIFADIGSDLDSANEITAVRDLWGKVRFVVRSRPDPTSSLALALDTLGRTTANLLGAHAHDPDDSILYANETGIDVTELLSEPSLPIRLDAPKVRLVDRQVIGRSWAKVAPTTDAHRVAHRIALFSLKGGVGRSTATAVAAWNLARRGVSVLVLDLDLESPGLSAGLLHSTELPEFGIVDWFVEDAVNQGVDLVPKMIARSQLARDLPGDIWVVPSFGASPGSYIPKLGRCYLDLTRNGVVEPWASRLARLIGALEDSSEPEVMLLDTRSGLHDLASAVVTELSDTVLLFGVGSDQTWSAYRLLFEHWNQFNVALAIRERLQIVAALVPETERAEHLEQFLNSAWNLFRDYLYDELAGGELDAYSFDLKDDPAPHRPLPIYWNRGLATLDSYTNMDPHLVDAAYGSFLRGLDVILPDL